MSLREDTVEVCVYSLADLSDSDDEASENTHERVRKKTKDETRDEIMQ